MNVTLETLDQIATTLETDAVDLLISDNKGQQKE